MTFSQFNPTCGKNATLLGPNAHFWPQLQIGCIFDARAATWFM
jgi:hypothetical protein